MQQILNQGYGYGFAVGLGAAFALLMVFITRVLAKYMGQVQNSERFTTASRSVKAGLISSATVSAWTWPATLLSSGAWSYAHGISGGYFYAVGGALEVTLFMFLAIQIKRRAPAAHTIPEIFQVRFGKWGHITFLCYCMATNVLTSALLLLGGSQAFATTTGMHTVAASFILPLGVIVYTALGGLKATFVSDWIHTVIIYVILLVLIFYMFCTSSLIGSPGKMYELLKEAQILHPAPGDSYLSFRDSDMNFLAWSVTLGNLCSVFGDPGYAQRAIAADARSVFEGYLMGGLCWWIIPMGLGSSAGLACRALLNNPVSVTYPNELTDFEVEAGLPVIYGMTAIFGKSGAAAALVMLFMSVTSATSAELIAFSSVVTYDLYRTYFRPRASGKELVLAAHTFVVAFGIFMAALSTVLNYVGVTVGWLLSFVGIILTPTVSIVILTLFWNKMTCLSLVIGAPVGTITGVVCWVGATYHYGNGVVDKTTLMITEATFIGNIVALGSTPIYVAIISYLKPDQVPFDMDVLATGFELADDVDEEGRKAIVVTDAEKHVLKKQVWTSALANSIILFGCHILVPLALYGSGYESTKAAFVAFIVINIIWVVLASAYIILTPLWQGRESIWTVTLALIGKLPDSKDEADSHESVEILVSPKDAASSH
ncbi:putative urea active transporter 2 [Candidozyma auris]|uniref:Transporter n=2 Tax=Candidozyma auris TaxID=498019 RepID=A0A2H0ZI07_CANAR|nr:hypothetical protein QG37_06627 [[Candida] auris]PIS49862.1 hypothetical protein B9J08_004889 [[Candida] auris]QWW25350.1 hypothetical protein CA7LBN_004232 [[Candida] auris]